MAVLILLLLAWHYSTQAAAHDAAIVQVRTWLQGMGASAGKVQFHLLRGALTVQNINVDIQGSTLNIKTLLIKGNPASMTSEHPQIQNVRIQGITLNADSMREHWQDVNIALPAALQNLFRYAQTIDIQDSIMTQAKHNIQISLQTLHISGSAAQREVVGQGKFQHYDDTGTWHVESYIPLNTSLQTGKIIAQSAKGQRSLNWTGAWQHGNMNIHFQHQINHDHSLSIKLQQDKQQWQGDIQAQSWTVKTSAFESLVSGSLKLSGTPATWQLNSDKLLWKNTIIQEHQTFIQTMTTQQLHMSKEQETIQMKRLDIEDVKMNISPRHLIVQPSWQWNISSINIKALKVSLGKNHENIQFPSMHGTASVHHNVLQLDISQQVDKNQFWRIQNKGNGSFYLSASYVPLIQIRNLLPNPIRNRSYTVKGTAWLQLHSTPKKQWQTSGKVYVSNMLLASKKQSFSAKEVELSIENADASGIKQANLRADTWAIQLPITPRQAWSNASLLEAWAEIPWSLDNIHLNHGKVLIGNHNSTWLSQADLHIQHWQSHQPASLTLKGEMGGAPLLVNMTLDQKENIMQTKSLHMDIQHANLFFLEDWLTLSELPYVSLGHGSLTLDVEQQQHGLMQGHVDIKLERLQLLSTQQRSFLDGDLQLKLTSSLQHIKTNFQAIEGRAWSEAAALALMQKIKTQQKSQQTNAIQRPTQLLGSLRIQHDVRLSLNERTRLRRMIKAIKQHKNAIIELIPDIGTVELTPTLRQKMIQTQAIIKSFMVKRGIQRENIYFILPQEKHQSIHDISAVHIYLAS
ncbi:MAG: hypothetical protein Q9N67_06610 [Ghiorsea sp.]|nr:hypothetical protein [Ghiorsea sp.]